MTKNEFLDDMTDLGDLYSFCMDNTLDFCDDLLSWDVVEDSIEEQLVDMARDYTWDELRDKLNYYDSISGGDWYILDDYDGDYRCVDDDQGLFEGIRDDIVEYMDENELWDEEDEVNESGWAMTSEEETAAFEDEQDDLPEEDCSISDMFYAGVGCVRSINDAAIEQRRQEDQAFVNFIF